MTNYLTIIGILALTIAVYFAANAAHMAVVAGMVR